MTTARSSFCFSKHHHPSKSEAEYCSWLLAMQQNKEIKSYRLYPSIELHVAGKLWRRWKIDFEVVELNGEISYHESKGWCRSDDRFRQKLAAFLLEYPNIKIYVNRKPVTLSPGLRIMADGLKRPNKRRLIRTWDRINHRWTTVRLGTPLNRHKGH